MPINSEIPLAVRAPEAPDVAREYGNALAIKSHIQQMAAQQQEMQLREQQRQENEVKLKQMRDDAADDEKIKTLWMQNNGDLDKVAAAARPLVSPKKSAALASAALEHQTKLATNGLEQNKLLVAQNNEAAGYVQGVLNEKDPQTRQAVWSNARMAAIKNKLPGADQQPEQVPDEPTLRMTLASLLGGATASMRAVEQITANARATQAQTSAADADARRPGLVADSQGKVRAAGVARLAAAGSPQEYNTILATLPHGDAVNLPVAEEVFGKDGKPVPEAIAALRMRGMNPAQQAAEVGRGVDREDREANQEDLQTYRNSMLSIARQRLARENAQTKNSKATDYRQARREYDLSTAAEQKLTNLRRSLGGAIADQSNYVDRLGNVVPMVKATGGNDASTAGLVQQMKDRYQQLSIDLKTTLANKYDAMDRLGGTPKYSLEDANRDLDAGDEKVFGPKQAAGSKKVETPKKAETPPFPAPVNALQPPGTEAPPAPIQKPATAPPAAPNGKPTEAPTQPAVTPGKPNGKPTEKPEAVLVNIDGKPQRFPSQAQFDLFLKENPEYDPKIPAENRPVRVVIDGVKRKFPNKKSFEAFKNDHPELSFSSNK